MVLPSMFIVMIKTIIPCSVFEDYDQTKLVSILCVASLLCVRPVINEHFVMKFRTSPHAHLHIASGPKFPSTWKKGELHIDFVFVLGGRGGGAMGLKLWFWKCLL